ncbi:MAG: hypothetical protein K0Q92_3367 [Steroidobacteraceae bacterium]|jgi:hypothetical protein|nr:hypothetical protein [Steroidobacteraceae bacterium]
MTSSDAERRELQRAIDALGRSTRPGRLLEYLGNKYFENPQGQLAEVDIAIDVFGRSAKTFDSTEDAVVRVEVHRLRKKLREIYEKAELRTGVQIALPAGTYVLQFITGAPPAAAEPAAAEPAKRFPRWALPGGLAIVVGLLVAGALYAFYKRDRPETRELESPPATAETPTPPQPGQITELHIMAGYSGSEVIDNSGVRWTPDQYFQRGGSWSRESGFVRGTSRPFLFSKWRTGEFGYDFPLVPGTYELRLFFVSPYKVGEEKLGNFDVALNGQPLLSAYDMVMSANGADIADEQVFRDVSPGPNGLLQLWFSNRIGSPMLSALSITPGEPGRLKPIRITMQPTSFVDHEGQRWRADDYWQNGFRSTDRPKVSGTEDPELFGAERFGRFRYAIPVDRRGRYTVKLHFAEFYYGPELAGKGGAGSRVFHVFCNGQSLLRDFDVYKEAGSLRMVTKTFTGIAPSAFGKINLDFEPVVNNATVSGIEVIEEQD